MSANEMMVTNNFELGITNNLAQMLSEELDGLGQIPFDRVKIPSGGGIAFEIPGENPDTPEMTTELEGIIVTHHPVNGFWKDKFNGAKEKPFCSSFDAKEGIDADGQIHNCDTCPHNQYGSDPEGKGKACKNMHRLYLLRSGEIVPMIVTLPPTSLKNAKDYFSHLVLKKRVRANHVITKLTLKKDVNGGGIIYSKAFFQCVGSLPVEAIPTIEKYATDLNVRNRDVELDGDEYASSSKQNQAYEPEYPEGYYDDTYIPDGENPFLPQLSEGKRAI